MPTKFRELAKMLKDNEWVLERVTGSHHIYSHPARGKISVPFHGDNKELRTGTLKAILNKAGVTIMVKYTATVEQAGDGSWTAAVNLGDHLILGDGDSRDEAIKSLYDGLSGAFSNDNIVIVEVAA